MKTNTFKSDSKEDTDKLATSFSEHLEGGELIFAYGDLGAGKTTFFKSLGKALGVNKTINSPTFNLVKIYNGTQYTLYHLDCYRFEGIEDEKKELGIDEYLGDKDCIFYVEWPQFSSRLFKDFKPKIIINFKILNENEREITINYEK